jgi:hypothetical protein
LATRDYAAVEIAKKLGQRVLHGQSSRGERG